MARAVVWKEKFIVGAIGSSVTAGHDNCAYDSYENQLERTMAKVWEAAGVEWEVRNAGEGGGCGDSFRNQIFCTRQMVGDDVDAIHYSWTYYEANGLNEAGRPDILLKHEEFVRFALSMARSPAPLFINTGGEKGNCPSVVDGAENGLLQKYAKWGINGVCLQAGLITHEGDESQCYPKCYEGKKWGAVGDGTHSSTNIDSPNKSLPTSVPLNKK